jgi:hypothetical protein
MDLNDYWQENKRSLVATGSGVALFAVGLLAIQNFFGTKLVEERKATTAAEQKLRNEPMYTADQLQQAEKENGELRAAVETLGQAAAFEARPAFKIDPKRGSPQNQYFTAVASVREQLLTLAGRQNLRLQEDLGLPALSPTKDIEIVRYLEALDLVDRAVRIALLAGVERIDKIEIKLDPRLASRQGVGELERTRVGLTMTGKPGPLVRFLTYSQSPDERARDGLEAWPALLLEKSEMLASRGKPDEVVLDATLVVARLAPQAVMPQSKTPAAEGAGAKKPASGSGSGRAKKSP